LIGNSGKISYHPPYLLPHLEGGDKGRGLRIVIGSNYGEPVIVPQTVMPTKAGIQKYTGFRVKPGMTKEIDDDFLRERKL